MTLEEFDRFPQRDRQTIFNDMSQLYEIICTHPADVKELRILADWHEPIGAFGDNLVAYLECLSPYK